MVAATAIASATAQSASRMRTAADGLRRGGSTSSTMQVIASANMLVACPLG